MWLPTDEGRLLSSLVDNRHPMSTMSCIDAVGKATKGLFDTNEKQYHSQVFEEPLEITSLLGSITRKEGEPYLHLHINVGNADHDVHGGHLNEAIISATGELFIRIIDGRVGRIFSDEIGLNLFEF